MKTEYIVKSSIRKFFNDRGKRLSGKALVALDQAVLGILERAAASSRGFKTVSDGEIAYAYRAVTGLAVI